jgi:hypothetical protein
MTGLRRRAVLAAGAAVIALALVAVATGGLTGVDRLWPVLLGAGIGFAPGAVAGRLGAFVLGVAAGWLGVVLRITVLPDTTVGRAAAGAAVLVLVVAVSVASRDRVPLWASLLGAAGFLALADATVVVDPTAFEAERLGVLGTMLLGGGLGAAAAVAARSVIAISGLGAVATDRERSSERERSSDGEAAP